MISMISFAGWVFLTGPPDFQYWGLGGLVKKKPPCIFQADYCGIIRCQINAITARHTSCIIYGLNEIHRQYINDNII